MILKMPAHISMQSPYDFKKFAVLYVDDEPMALKYFEKTFGGEFRIITAENANEGMRILEQRGDEIGILLTDQRMPGEKGVQLLERARQLRPRIVRMIITAYADLGVTVDAVNLGNIFRYISKPLQVDDMRNTLRRGMEFFLVQHERDDLLREKLSVLQNVLITDRVISMGVLAAGLKDRFIRPLAAIESFLQLTSSMSMSEPSFHHESLNPGFWKEFHHAVVHQAERVADMVDEIGHEAEIHRNQALASLNTVIHKAHEAEAQRIQDQDLHVALPDSRTLPDLQVSSGLTPAIAMMLRLEAALLDPGSTIGLNVSEAGGRIRIDAFHAGPGIPAEDLRAVFDPRHGSAGARLDWGLSVLGLMLLASDFHGEVRLGPPPEGSGGCISLLVPLQQGQTTDAHHGEFVERVLVNDALWTRVLTPLGGAGMETGS